jgi:hypothetical protein
VHPAHTALLHLPRPTGLLLELWRQVVLLQEAVCHQVGVFAIVQRQLQLQAAVHLHVKHAVPLAPRVPATPRAHRPGLRRVHNHANLVPAGPRHAPAVRRDAAVRLTHNLGFAVLGARLQQLVRVTHLDARWQPRRRGTTASSSLGLGLLGCGLLCCRRLALLNEGAVRRLRLRISLRGWVGVCACGAGLGTCASVARQLALLSCTAT